MTRPPVALARKALEVASDALPAYSSPFAKRTFTRPQLVALLAPKQFFKTDYRGVVQIVADFDELRDAPGLASVPHYPTLCHAHRRLLRKKPRRAARRRVRVGGRGGADRRQARGGGRRGRPGDAPRGGVLRPPPRAQAAPPAQADAGRARGDAPVRRGRRRRGAAARFAGLHAGDAGGVGPRPVRPTAGRLLGDSGYDGEQHYHALAREELGIRSTVIKLNPRDSGRRWPDTSTDGR
jgi:hypothetical protein